MNYKIQIIKTITKSYINSYYYLINIINKKIAKKFW